VSEDGFERVMGVLLERGIGIEAGVWSVEDAERLAASGLGGRVTRILVEPVGAQGSLERVGAIHDALDRLGLARPRLQHGDSEGAWILLADALRRGLDTRVGFEDTLEGPDGRRAESNQALIRAAISSVPVVD
jgi:uncharacterized protein (DUF849 family)